MKYYEMHEVVYQRIKTEGRLSWDKATSFDELWSHDTNVYLKKNLMLLGLFFKGLRILDLGTGTGTSALYSSKEGACSVGVEFSKTAIEIARSNAQQLKLQIEFIQGDVLELNLNREFDIVVDSTILHCIVGIEDRQKFYESAKRHLAMNGYLFINTMISIGDMSSSFPHEYFHVEDNILWSLGINATIERKTINGKSYFPHRTLLTKEKQIEEFKNNGFDIVNMEITSGEEVKCMVGFLKLKS